jgi:pimeloyl-ACP methyl ester carboxylesterase
MRSVIPARTSRSRAPLQTAAVLGLAGLAASLLYVQSKRRAAERAHRPQGHVIEVDGVRLHYVERGKGDALVLLHGNGMLSNDFDLSGLQDHADRPYRMIAFDRPGFGHSERPGAAAWTPERQAQLIYKALHQLGVERPVVLGHGWGTLVTLAMALAYPKYTRAIALASGSYYPAPRISAPWLSAASLPGIGHLLRHTLAPLLGRVLWPPMTKRLFAPADVTERFAQASMWMALRPSQLGASAAEAAMASAAARRLSARYGELLMPIVIIAGGEDELVNPDHNALRLHAEIQHSDLVIDNYAGHMPQDTDPARVMAALERLEARSAPGGVQLHRVANLAGPPTLH